VKSFTADCSGATAIEYGLLIALIALVIVSAVTSVGTNINSIMVRVATGLR
jgi:pilus assembly protein Flp/PilA